MKESDSLTAMYIDGVKLSERSIQVLQLLIYGKTVKKIAHTLGLSPRTVETHLINVKRKLNVSTKSDLIEKVMTHVCCLKCCKKKECNH